MPTMEFFIILRQKNNSNDDQTLYMHINIICKIYIQSINGQKNSKKGLASASKKTKTKVARKGGKA